MRVRCLCRCHEGSVTDKRYRADGVDVRDPIEAVVACDACRNAHCPALLAPEPEPPAPRPVTPGWTPADDQC
jgi:hypothetical protein